MKLYERAMNEANSLSEREQIAAGEICRILSKYRLSFSQTKKVLVYLEKINNLLEREK